MLALDRSAVPCKSLPALLADRLSRANLLVQLGFDEDTVPAAAAAEPSAKRLLVGKRSGIHRSKFGSEQFRVGAPNAKDYKGASVADE
jgi:hypothetical protein